MSSGEATEAELEMGSQRLGVSDRRRNSSMMRKQEAESRASLEKALGVLGGTAVSS